MPSANVKGSKIFAPSENSPRVNFASLVRIRKEKVRTWLNLINPRPRFNGFAILTVRVKFAFYGPFRTER